MINQADQVWRMDNTGNLQFQLLSEVEALKEITATIVKWDFNVTSTHKTIYLLPVSSFGR